MKCYRMSTHRACRKILDRILIFLEIFKINFQNFNKKMLFFLDLWIFFWKSSNKFSKFHFFKIFKISTKKSNFSARNKSCSTLFPKKKLKFLNIFLENLQINLRNFQNGFIWKFRKNENFDELKKWEKMFENFWFFFLCLNITQGL